MFGDSTLKYIKDLQTEGIDIFYIGEGNPKCYKLNLKHISFSKVMGLTRTQGKLDNGDTVYAVNTDELYVVIPWDSIVRKLVKHETISSPDLENLE